MMSRRPLMEAGVENQRVRSGQVADALQWVAYSLFIVFLAQLIAAAIPVALIQPQWILRMATALRASANLPLLGMLLLLLANLLDEAVSPSSRQLRRLRRIATAAAIGYLLLIPIQSFSAVRSINSQINQRRDQLNKVTAATNQLQVATNELQIREAIRAMPGGEQLADQPFRVDPQTVKTNLMTQLRAGVKRQQNELTEIQSNAIQNTFLPLARDGIVSLAYALGFAGIGSGRSGQVNALRGILRPRSPELQKDGISNWPGLPGIPRKR